ncbi:MAG: leucine-rich repeat domain-containing protein [Bacteroidales bacterium]|nr:leucine-rich repeat domain-containing protein [Bacteroidales bacterium]
MKHILLSILCALLFTMQAKAEKRGEGWSLSADSTLTISADISYDLPANYPWNSYRKSIKKVIINEGVTSIGIDAFYFCSSLTSINIPESVTSIGYYAFTGCSSLTSITIPESVTSIGKQAFTGCSSLSSITFPESITSIGYQAFSSCSSLTSINIPESVTSIESGAFSGCSSLTSINVDENNTKYDSRNNCNAIIETESNTLIAGCQNTIILESVTSIGGWAFSGCSSLSSINIPESVTSIGDWAFRNCSSLTSINIPSSVTSIGKQAFSYCGSLTSIKVDENNTTYDSRNNCNAIIETASNTLIAGCQNTIFPESVTSIGDAAFSYCRKLTSIVIPKEITSIGNEAFRSSSSLTNIVISESVTSIGDYVFYDCSSLISIAIPKGITSIGTSMFRGCSSLTSIVIPDDVTSIGGYAFRDCSSLTSINIPESVTSIGSSTFYGCSSLSSVYSYATTPAEIGNYVFYGANENLIIYIPKGTTEAYKAAWGEELNFVEVPASFEYDSNYGDIKLIKWTSSEADVMTIRIAPADGYELQSITLDGVDLLQAAEDATTKAVMNDDGTYTISGLSGDNLAVVVNFSVSTPVNTISCNQEAEIAAVYSLTGAYVGKSLQNLQSGLYIVVYSNGETDKALVK